MRTYPIRVGNLEHGYSGPFYEDSTETTWEELNLAPEYTTNTRRIRRVATFSKKQYRKMLALFKPDYVFLNFANYLNPDDLTNMLSTLPEVTHVGYGPTMDDILSRLESNTLCF